MLALRRAARVSGRTLDSATVLGSGDGCAGLLPASEARQVRQRLAEPLFRQRAELAARGSGAQGPEGLDIIRFSDNAATIAAYVGGQTDVIVTGNTVAAQLGADNPDVSIATRR